MTDYALLCEQLKESAKGVRYGITVLANASALVNETLENINWAGFYQMLDGALWLGPFQGKPACTVIAPGKGVCGTAAMTGRVQRVADVHALAGHSACDSATNAEIVIPLNVHGVLFGVLDIDSPLPDRFSQEDEEGLCLFARQLEYILEALP